MAIDTIEEALVDMGHTLQQTRMTEAVRSALKEGNAYEVTITISNGRKNGNFVNMHGRVVSEQQPYGRLIRLK
ncbi:hypothetical protein L0636_01100 [Halomonas janggokensis]|uniref:Uncharacterized protein n=1 Tax=Vreelandella janggokensis TaxID=370767 RepID=A0ABT4IS39_9GAMM|nr:hypothetical protein [Halomonas janggokensis]MCZ0926485.1 hypothetical protein [Halomonas janggokensis]MCZ0929023.1 hypothetical protein [Halomonas janggokensis]